MIRRLRMLPAVAVLGLLVACGSPTGPEIPGPDPEDESGDPKTGVRLGAFEVTTAPAMLILI
jgi:hypothetical protein